MKEILYTVAYHAATYSGTKQVWAADADHAVAKVRAWVRKEMSLPMYSDSYRVVGSES